MILRLITITLVTQQVLSQQSPCKFTTVRNSGNIWKFIVDFEWPKDFSDPTIEISYKRTANFETMMGSKTFTDYSLLHKRGERAQIPVTINFSKHSQNPAMSGEPIVKEIKVNDVTLCSGSSSGDNENVNEGQREEQTKKDDKCVKFEMDEPNVGEWNGTLTLYSTPTDRDLRVDLTYKHEGKLQKNSVFLDAHEVGPFPMTLLVFFAGYDELGEIPELLTLHINNVETCLDVVTDSQSSKTTNSNSESTPRTRITTPYIDSEEETTTKKHEKLLFFFKDLKVKRNPTVSRISSEVNNENFQCGSASSTHLINEGIEAGRGQFPFHVAIFGRERQYYICGGSLISSKAVLTAAHCVVNSSNELRDKSIYKLLFGAIDLMNLQGTEAVRDVEKMIKHPDYDNEGVMLEDIALIFIKGQIQFTDKIIPICLFQSHTSITNQVDQQFTILGFGSDANSIDPSQYLKHGQMTIITRRQCIVSNLKFGLLSEHSAFCAKSFQNEVTCGGDVGGGLIEIVNGKYHLRGITSVLITENGQSCGPNRAVAFTDVSYFLSWIYQNLGVKQDGEKKFDNDQSCVKFKMDKLYNGRWDGSLTIYLQPSLQQTFTRIRLDFIFSRQIERLYVDLLSSIVNDGNRFTIETYNLFSLGTSLTVNISFDFDKNHAVPELKSFYLNNILTCLTDVTLRINAPTNSNAETTPRTRITSRYIDSVVENGTRQDDQVLFFFKDLKVERHPMVSSEVNNENFQCGSASITTLINEGIEAERGQFPFHVAIFGRERQYYICGGSLISSKAVLTAAHCVVNSSNELRDKSNYKLLFGAVDLLNLQGTEAVRDVEKMIKHPDYDNEGVMLEDIALIFIKGQIQFTDKIIPICLFQSHTSITNQVDQQFTILGFGSDAKSIDPSQYLKHGQMTIITRRQCIVSNLKFGLLSERSAFCAKSFQNERVCRGDSGGGLITLASSAGNKRYHLRGITSVAVKEGDLNCDPNRAVAFTDVSYFLSWIYKNLGVKQDDEKKFNNDQSCVKFKMDKLYNGRWDGSLTIYLQPSLQQTFTRIRLDFIFSRQIERLYVDLLSSIVNDGNRFTIETYNLFSLGTSLTVNMSFDFDKNHAVPELKSFYLNNILTCLTDVTLRINTPTNSNVVTTPRT